MASLNSRALLFCEKSLDELKQVVDEAINFIYEDGCPNDSITSSMDGRSTNEIEDADAGNTASVKRSNRFKRGVLCGFNRIVKTNRCYRKQNGDSQISPESKSAANNARWLHSLDEYDEDAPTYTITWMNASGEARCLSPKYYGGNIRDAMATPRPKHIMQLSTEDKRKFLDSFDYVFSDIDGVIWNLDKNVCGAANGFKALQQAGKHIKFITNNSVRPIENCLSEFGILDMKVNKDDIWHPARNIVAYLKSINFDGLIYIIATEIVKSELRDAGFELIDGPNEILEETYSALAHHIFDLKPVRAVVIDVDFNLNSAKILRAHRYLSHPECMLIAGATDRFLPVTKDTSILGPGPFTNILYETGDKPMLTLGKPGKELGKMLLKQLNITEPHRTLMIGDMLEQDVGFGKVCGFQTLLVFTGGCKMHDLQAVKKPELLPDYYTDSITDFVKFIRDLKKYNV